MKCPNCGNEQWYFVDGSDYAYCGDCGSVRIKTNGDRIRAMSDEELATLLSEEPWTQPANWIDWLKREVADD